MRPKASCFAWGDGLLPAKSRGRIVVLDTGVLTTEIISALKRPGPSSLLRALRSGLVRGFIPHHVWAEVPRVLEQRHRGHGEFDLAAAQRMWWSAYVPVIYVVSTDHLPVSEKASALALRDPSDVGSLLLLEVLAPASLWAEDKDLVDSGLACAVWREVRAALGLISAAEESRRGADMVTNTTINGGALAVGQALRAARAHPLIALGVAAVLAAFGNWYVRAHPGQVSAQAKKVALAAVTTLGEAYEQARQQYRSGQVVWSRAETGQQGLGTLHQVARLLASQGPMTRTEILEELEEVPAGFGHRALMDDLYRMLREFPMFCEVSEGRWQVGRQSVDFGGAIAAQERRY